MLWCVWCTRSGLCWELALTFDLPAVTNFAAELRYCYHTLVLLVDNTYKISYIHCKISSLFTLTGVLRIQRLKRSSGQLSADSDAGRRVRTLAVLLQALNRITALHMFQKAVKLRQSLSWLQWTRSSSLMHRPHVKKQWNWGSHYPGYSGLIAHHSCIGPMS